MVPNMRVFGEPVPLTENSPVTTVKICGIPLGCILDTGAETSLIPASFYEKHLKEKVGLARLEPSIHVFGANGQEVSVLGYCIAPVVFGTIKLESCFLVKSDTVESIDRQIEYPGILGCNILRKLARVIESNKEEFKKLSLDWKLALTITTMCDQKDENIEETESNSLETLLRVNKLQNLPPKKVSILRCNLAGTDWKDKTILVESQIGISAKGHPMHVFEGCYKVDSKGSTQLLVCNFSQEPYLVTPFMSLASASKIVMHTVPILEMSELEGPIIAVREAGFTGGQYLGEFSSSERNHTKCKTTEAMEVGSKREIFICRSGEEITLPLGVDLSNLDLIEGEKVAKLFQHRAEAFSNGDYDLGFCDLIPHKIQLCDNKPVNLPYRRIPPHEVNEIKQELQKMLNKGVIRKSASPYGSPIVIVRKKYGAVRLCVDYRRLNSKTLPDAFPLPRIEESLEALDNARLFSALDLHHGYFQVAMDPESIPATAFRVPWGLFEFLRLPQGLKNSPSTFQRIIEHILGDLNFTSLLLYLDDILIFSDTMDQHIERLDKVLERLIQFGLKLNGKKCNFFQKEVRYLGHIVNKEGISVDPSKIKKIVNWPKPKTAEELRSFIGLASYYRRFIRNFSRIVSPLYSLINDRQEQEKAGKQVSGINWGSESEQAFITLKDLLTDSPVLAYPDFKKEFVVEVDASLQGLGACLSQYDEKKELHPIAFASRGLRGAEKNYSDYSS